MSERFNLDLLRLLVAVADGGNFSRAASGLGRTQSAVSMQARRLEEIAGRMLFVRAARRVRLTPAGESLARYARRILALESEARAGLARNEPPGIVRLGTPDDYVHFLPALLRRFAERHPRVAVELTCAESAGLFPALADNAIDLAIVTRGPGQDADVLRREPLVWIASPSAWPEQNDPLPLALYQPGCVGRDHALRALTRSDRAIRLAYESPSMAGLLAAARAGLAVAVLARTSVPPDLRIISDAGLPALPALEVSLARNRAAASPPIDALAALIVEEIGEPLAISAAELMQRVVS
ncbi:LysR family transcriptional regulator [Vineibacter terrae]|uniref:LysR family transcriptional regulator n=1 Tax=Vineibacter terrae TaxID=2586908 RepID=A0A5C8PW55_9HYPH|nr:LysR substrate-binding domain-containing protein [Vineibacter terrae]TXL82291.1 LysR family transcriptional regulator [Vineibacter terrae]